MKTRHIYSGLLLAAAALLCLAGCKKDEEGEKIMLGTQFEKAVSVQKTWLGENNSVCWSAGDSVNVNSNKYVAGSSISVTEADHYYAVYPYSSSNTVGENGGTVEIPATQTYTVDGNGVQQLKAPMAARLDASSGILYFKNLYSLLKVTVSADDKAFTVNSITVTATDNNAKALAGTYDFSFVLSQKTGKTDSVSINTFAKTDKDSSKSVKLTGINTPVAANNDVDFYLVAHPMTSQNLTVKVKGVLDGKMVVYTYHTASARSLNRNSIGGLGINLQQLTAEAFKGFSVGTDTYVTFSSGNLQWSAAGGTAAGTWRFAEHQWDYIGNAAGNTTASDRDKQSDWIDLFGWGTSGYNSKYPYMTSQTNTNYGDGTNNIAGTNYDWGVYNAIYNPKTKSTDAAGTWRTLTNAEWAYLLGTGAGTRGGENSGWWIYNLVKIKAADGTNDVMGLIIYPDGVTEDITGKLSSKSGTSVTEISKAEFETLEAMGCVFLPAAGYRGGTSVSYAGSDGYYWSSSYYNSSRAYYLYFYTGFVNPSNTGGYRYGGRSVRLVKDVE